MGSAPPAGAGFFPLDEELGLLAGNLTPRLQEGLVRLSTHIPSFAKASAEFAFWTDLEVHRTTASRLTEAAGATAVALQTAEAEQILQTQPLSPPGPEQLVFSVDGAMVPLLHGRWAEARTLAVGQPIVAINAEGQEVVQTSALSYFSRLTDSASFGELATVEIHRRGVERAGRVGVVVDGAEWCQTFIDLHAPQAVRILDFPHAAEYVEAIGQTVVADGPLLQTAERTRLCQELKHHGPTAVVEQLRDTIAQAGAPGETASKLAYLEKRVAQMDYPAFRAQQWPLGSGMVESANKLVVEERMKGPGMHWAEAHVDPMLALRNALCSERWSEVWMQIEQEQRRAQHQRRSERQRQRREAVTGQEKVCLATEVSERRHDKSGDSEYAAVPEVPEKPASERSVPSASHPWRKAWSIRRQQELASTA
jgi:hypothetical protein